MNVDFEIQQCLRQIRELSAQCGVDSSVAEALILQKRDDGSWFLSFGQADRTRAARLEQFCSWVNEDRTDLLPRALQRRSAMASRCLPTPL